MTRQKHQNSDINIPDVTKYRDLRRRSKRLENSFVLQVPIEQLTKYTGQVDLLNKLSGNSPVEYRFLPQARGGTINLATSKKGGISLRYTELPYEWSFPFFTWAEIFPVNGPLSYIRMGYDFQKINNETYCRAFLDYTTRGTGLLGTIAAKNFFKLLRAALQKISREPLKQDELAISPFRNTKSRLKIETEKLQRHFARLTDNRQIIDAATDFLSFAPDKHIRKIRPIHFARHYNLEEIPVIEFFLRAVRQGLFTMSWDILCPSCRGDKAKYDKLSVVELAAHCDTCNIQYDGNFSENVELTFQPSVKICEANELQYCINAPGNTRHVHAQVNIWPDEILEYDFLFKEPAYSLKNADGSIGRSVIVDDENGSDFIELRFPADLEKKERLLIKSQTKFRFQSSVDQPWPVTARFMTEGYRDFALSAARVTAMQEFRDLFSDQVLAPGYQVGVQHLAFLFSDLKNSTPMYEDMGDAPAFALVRDHFDLLTQIIRRHNGAVVKTIGDAVMAVFTHEKDACLASSDILTSLREKFPRISVKLGIHAGPCLAVTSNDKLDYFGSTVNKAARIQGLARGGDTVLPEHLVSEDIFPEEKYVRESFTSPLKGFSDSVYLARYSLREQT